MQNINFIGKLGLAFFLFIFALWFDQIAYNMVIILILIATLIKEKISPFRFPKQILVFSIFLFFIFFFQAVNGYGKIVFNLPLQMTITQEGILAGVKFVTQILLIFLLFGAAIYSSRKDEILYYFRKAGRLISITGRNTERFIRIGMFSFYMLPRSIKVQKKVSSDMNSQYKIHSMNFRQRINMVSDSIYHFFYTIISTSEMEYEQFVIQSNESKGFSAKPLLTIRNILISVTVLVIHGILIWRH